MNYPMMNAPNVATRSPIPARLSGESLVPAGVCQVPGEIGAGDVLRVDFDADSVTRDGFYLVEAVTADGVDWMGCRRFARTVGGVLMQEAGQWIEPAGLRIAGRVVTVYRAV